MELVKRLKRGNKGMECAMVRWMMVCLRLTGYTTVVTARESIHELIKYLSSLNNLYVNLFFFTRIENSGSLFFVQGKLRTLAGLQPAYDDDDFFLLFYFRLFALSWVHGRRKEERTRLLSTKNKKKRSKLNVKFQKRSEKSLFFFFS